MSLEQLRAELLEFVEERDWQQYHTPKNFAAALTCEAGEVLDRFIWMSDEDARNVKTLDPEAYEKIRLEIGDVMINLIQLCRHLEIDPEQAARDKLAKLKQRYATALVKGKRPKIPDQEHTTV